MKSVYERVMGSTWLPYMLLVVTGMSIALMLPLGKVAVSAGVDPLAYAFWQAAGGGLILSVLQIYREGVRQPVYPRYFLISGLTAIAIPNAIAFAITVELGAAFTSVFYAMPALVTYGIALVLKLERIQWLRALGLGVSAVGCMWVLLADAPSAVSNDHIYSMLLGLLIPLALGFGNVYRTQAWPKAAKPMQLAPGMLLAGASCIFILLLIQGRLPVLLLPNSEIVWILMVQSILTAQSYILFFQLQKIASPVFLSQLGFIIIPTGLVVGSIFLGEKISEEFLMGVLILFIGMWLSNRKSNDSPVAKGKEQAT